MSHISGWQPDKSWVGIPSDMTIVPLIMVAFFPLESLLIRYHTSAMRDALTHIKPRIAFIADY